MITELTDASFDKEVLQYPGTVLVDFYSPDCGPCRVMAPLLDQIALERGGSLKIVKLNAWEQTRVAAQYRVNAVPVLLLFRDGQVARQRTGACSKKDLTAWIDAQN